MNAIIANIEVEEELAEDIREFFYETYNTRERQEELNSFFDMIPNTFQLIV